MFPRWSHFVGAVGIRQIFFIFSVEIQKPCSFIVHLHLNQSSLFVLLPSPKQPAYDPKLFCGAACLKHLFKGIVHIKRCCIVNIIVYNAAVNFCGYLVRLLVQHRQVLPGYITVKVNGGDFPYIAAINHACKVITKKSRPKWTA